ncbi:MAG: UDP-N-acetylglucosamine 1-carboxyvinyltransferase [Candidatus Limivicinus sp.]|nr:UDP-N-acetylglucosamine 1-carboxyvinyltransferase [Clostridiales bacterium]MCI7137755.1 UDP-N-acetylglucosamine 1-carboxyvinyltransferase [Clostridiales bacterium]MDY6132775.1 UDP-N-acetylglucosamine 1-carboxyvinyltransferase [Candidatus Limivicinus sp.]
MELWHIRGGNRLEGACFVQGSKNASLPILAASIICPASTELLNVPQLRDVDAALRILRHLGCWAEQSGGEVTIDSRNLSCCSIPHSLMVEMRSSVIFMGALLARCGEARLSLPGGCQLGKRPIDLHLAALRKMGAEIEEDRGEIFCRAEALKGAEIVLPFPSVGATENIMLAACAARGETVIHGAAREPEIAALQDYLKAMGADVRGAGTDTVTIGSLSPEKHIACRIIPDRIVASTIACAAACTGGNVELRGIDPRQFSTVLRFLNQAGCDIISTDRSVRLRSEGELKAVGEISTAPYPGFPTDAQPVLMAALLKAKGLTRITENIFENRYRQVPELCRLGADIVTHGKIAEIWGVDCLHGTALTATDLRGGAAMIVAGLSAQGETLICDDGHISRGYERFDIRLRALGADISLEY